MLATCSQRGGKRWLRGIATTFYPHNFLLNQVFVHCIFYIEDIVNKYLLTHLLPPVANGRQYVASKISASVKEALVHALPAPNKKLLSTWCNVLICQ